MTKEQLAPLVEQRRISIRRVQDAVAKEFHLTRAELLSRSRGQRIAYARHIAMFLSRELAGQTAGLAHDTGARPKPGVSFPRIAMAFCRDHFSVIHACKAIECRRQFDPGMARLLRRLGAEVHDYDARQVS
jgi:chromosomal replication initiator protein